MDGWVGGWVSGCVKTGCTYEVWNVIWISTLFESIDSVLVKVTTWKKIVWLVMEGNSNTFQFLVDINGRSHASFQKTKEFQAKVNTCPPCAARPTRAIRRNYWSHQFILVTSNWLSASGTCLCNFSAYVCVYQIDFLLTFPHPNSGFKENSRPGPVTRNRSQVDTI